MRYRDGSRDGRPVVLRVGEKRKILVVDDEPLILELVVAVLDNQAFDVRTEEAADEALAWARSVDGDIDLLVTDMAMPELTGEQLASELASLFPRLRVLLMSGRPEDAAVADAHAGWDYMKKPFSVTDLEEKVVAMLADPD